MLHQLKIEENYLANLMNGRKKSEIRFNDRDYQVGDTLQFVDVFFVITHIHYGLGMMAGYVVLSVENCHNRKDSHE